MTSFCINLLNAVDYNDNINTINTTCYSISNAYGSVFGTLMLNDLNNQSQKIIETKKKLMGHTNCDLKRPSKPPIWLQTPHYFPRLLQECNNAELAYKKCIQLSRTTTYPNEALTNCALDFSVITINK